jgi:N-acetylmuramoyl-L-alanine amidase
MDINFIDAQLTCMSVAIYHEAHTQSEKAKKAVGEIILNRAKHKQFGKTPCEVIHQKGQFLGIEDQTHKEATQEDFLKTKLIAWKVWFKPENIIGNRLYFYDDSIKLKKHKNDLKIDNLIFY